MTPLDRSARLTTLVASLLLTASFAGCVGLPGADGDRDEDEHARLYVSAVQDDPEDGTATIDAATVTLAEASAPEVLELTRTEIELRPLVEDSTAQLVATTPARGNATNLTVSFEEITLGDATVAGAELQLPAQFPLRPGLDMTLTLDLDETLDREEPTLDSLVVQDGTETLETVTRSQLEPREDPPELPTPTVHTASDGGNNTGPSFLVNEDITFTYSIPDSEANVSNAYWAFGDDDTAQGHEATHAYRAPGFYEATLVLEGDRGQQSVTSTAIDAYMVEEGTDNVGVGTGGSGLIEDRDSKVHTVEVPGAFTEIRADVTHTPSAGLCDPETGDQCAPSNVHIELYTPDGDKVAEDTSSDENKTLHVTGLLQEGAWELRVLGDQGAAVGYDYRIQANFYGLCADEGGLPGFDCGDPPEAIDDEDDGLL